MILLLSRDDNTAARQIEHKDHEALLIVLQEAISDFKFIEREVPGSNFSASRLGLEYFLKELTI